MFSPRQLFLTALLGGIGTAAWWWLDTQPPGPKPARSVERRPDYVVEQIRATQMDETGRVHQYLEAKELRHYPNDESSELEQPTLTLFADTGPPWHARAATGWVSQDAEELRLRGQVVVQRDASATSRPVRIETEALLVRPRQEYAETDLPVRIASGADWVRSEGLRAWLGESLRLELAGRARAELHTTDETSE